MRQLVFTKASKYKDMTDFIKTFGNPEDTPGEFHRNAVLRFLTLQPWQEDHCFSKDYKGFYLIDSIMPVIPSDYSMIFNLDELKINIEQTDYWKFTRFLSEFNLDNPDLDEAMPEQYGRPGELFGYEEGQYHWPEYFSQLPVTTKTNMILQEHGIQPLRVGSCWQLAIITEEVYEILDNMDQFPYSTSCPVTIDDYKM